MVRGAIGPLASFIATDITTGNRLVIERGADHGSLLSELSPQDMR